MNLIRKNAPVAINRCFEYDYSKIKQVLENQFNSVIGSADFFRDKNVVLKPNLLMKASPDKSVTTHPVVMEAVIDIIKSYGPRSVKIAESPGGPYNATSLGIIYRSTGMTAVAEKCGIELNFDTTAEHVSNPDGAVCIRFTDLYADALLHPSVDRHHQFKDQAYFKEFLLAFLHRVKDQPFDHLVCGVGFGAGCGTLYLLYAGDHPVPADCSVNGRLHRLL